MTFSMFWLSNLNLEFLSFWLLTIQQMIGLLLCWMPMDMKGVMDSEYYKSSFGWSIQPLCPVTGLYVLYLLFDVE